MLGPDRGGSSDANRVNESATLYAEEDAHAAVRNAKVFVPSAMVDSQLWSPLSRGGSVSESKKKGGSQGPAFATRRELKSIETALTRMRSELEELEKRSVTGGDLDARTRGLEDQLIRALRDANRADIRDRFNSIEEELQLLRKQRQVQVGHLDQLLEQVRSDLSLYQQHLAELDARTADERIRNAVEAQGEVRAEQAFRKHIEPKLSELEVAYDDADDRLSQLKAYIDSFGPGGLPVLAQERDALRERIGELEAQLGGERTRGDELLARVRQLENSQLKRVLDKGVTPELLEARLEELRAQTSDLRERRALQSENERLGAKVQQLETELVSWRDDAQLAEVARTERAQLTRYERERDEAEERREEAERRAQAAKSAERRARDREASALSRLAEVEGAEKAAAEREARLEAVSEELGQYRRELEESEARESRARAELERSRGEALALRAELEDARDHLQVAESKWRASFADEKEEEFEAAHERYREAAATEARAMRLDLERRLQDAVSRRDTALEDLAKLRSELHTVQAELRSSQLAKLQAQELLESTRSQHEQEIICLENTVSDRKQQLDKEHQERQERLRSEIEHERQRALAATTQEKGMLEHALDVLETELGRLSQDRDELYADITENAAKKGVLEAELQVLLSRLDELRTKDVPEEERLGKLREPVFSDLPPAEDAHELDWLQIVEDGIREAGFQFHPRLLRAFHTSLKIADHAPLAVLAGISGTGKSELPRLYSDLGGLPFLELAVQPSWDSPQDLFGFFNYTDGRLKAEPLARLLHQLGRPQDPLRDSPLIVLLDEMNLARVEYYFAALLSKLETRRGVDDLSPVDRSRAAIRLDAGPGARELLLFPDRRALFVGTMNEDESTLTLSDKVLDRACVLTFPAPDAMEDREQPRRFKRETRLSWASWSSWQQADRSADLADELNQLNGAMRKVGRPFGHRLFRAIHAYVALYPHTDPEVGHKEALADQWAMKVLPRLKGLECDDKRVRSGLEQLRALVPEELEPAFQEARNREFFSFSGAAEVYRSDA